MRINFNPYVKNNYLNQFKRNDFENRSALNKTNCNTGECIKIYNPAFCAYHKPQPIYAFSRDNAILKFQSKTDAMTTLGINYCSLAKCLEGTCHEANGYSFAYAKDVEIKNEDGTIELDEKVIKKIREGFSNSKKTPVYALFLDGSTKRFDSLTIASQELEIPVRSISKTALGYGHTANGCVFVNADEIEIRDDKGALVYDKKGQPLLNMEVKKAMLEKFSKAYRGPVCSIDCFGRIERFQDEEEAFSDFGTKVRIARDVGEKPRVFSKRIFVQENVIISRDKQGHAKYDKNGNYIYDVSKINKLLEAFEDVKIRPIKARNIITNEVIEFESTTQAAKALGLTKQAINQNLSGKTKLTSGYKFEYLYPRTIKSYTLIAE